MLQRCFRALGHAPLIHAVFLPVSCGSLLAGTATFDFTTDPTQGQNIVIAGNNPTPWQSSGGNPGGFLALTYPVDGQNTGVVFPDIDPGKLVTAFKLEMDLRIGNSEGARAADGFSISFARAGDPALADPGVQGNYAGGIAEGGTTTGIAISFDTWQGNTLPDGADIEGIIVRVDNRTVLRQALPTRHGACEDPTSLQTGPRDLEFWANLGDIYTADAWKTLCWQPLSVELDSSAKLTVKWKGNTILNGFQTDFFPSPGRLVLAGRTGGENEHTHVDNIKLTTTASSTPVVSRVSGSSSGVVIQITDVATQVNPGTITLSVNGSSVTPQIFKNGDVTSVVFTPAGGFVVGSTNTATISFSDNATPANSQTVPLSFVISARPGIAIVPAANATTVDKSKSGFRIRTYETEERDPIGNSIAWAEEQLAGGHGPNLADPTGADASGFRTVTVINYDIAGGAGNFTPDDPIPGLPGTGTRDGGTGNAAVEIQTYLEFPTAGTYTMGVNSDDGFKVSTAKNFDRFGLKLGEFDQPGGRGAADTTFSILIPQPGIYPFRLVWQNGGGGANLEWFALDSTGKKVLINDPNEPTAIKAYYEGPAGPFVRSLTPFPGARLVSINDSINIVLGNGTTSVQTNTIQLSINGQQVTPNISKTGNDIAVNYKPAGGFPRDILNVRLVYSDNATPANTFSAEYSFSTEEQLLIGVNETQLWRYENNGRDLGTAWKEKNYDDSGWINQEGAPAVGPALFGLETGAVVDVIRTPLMRTSPDGQIVTDYFRTHFTFTGDPTKARLSLRHVVDDSLVVYLNGVEVHRLRVPAGQNFQTIGGDHENSWEGPFDISAASLVEGDNVIAVEVHQSSTGSSDVVFGLELTYKIVNDTIPPTVVGAEEGSSPSSVNISFSEAVDLASAQNPANYVLTPLVGAPRLAVTTAAVTAGTNVTLTTSPRAAGTFYLLTISNVKDVAGNPITPNPTRIPVSSRTILVGINDTQMWRYENNGRDLGTAWKEKNYDDSGWLNQNGEPAIGPALLAVESGATAEPIRTTLMRTGPDGQIITDYFRTHFTFTGDPAAVRLLLRHVVDDSVVVYLNGQEVHRIRVPANQNFQTLGGDHENSYEGPFEIPTSALVVGDNVIAAEVHQSSAGSSDIVFGLELVAVSTPALPVQTTVVGIDANTKWKYQNTGADLGTAWKEPAFDDNAWPEGSPLFALESGAVAEPIRTPLVRSANGQGIITDYFRTRFNFNGDPAKAKLVIRHVVDDGFVLYLNGTEVYRFGVAANQTFQTTASDHENTYEGPFEIPSAALRSGENVLAAELHQGSATSSDAVFGLELVVVTTEKGPAQPTIAISRNGAQVTITSSDGGTVQATDNLETPNWTSLGSAPQTVNAAGAKRFFRIVK